MLARHMQRDAPDGPGQLPVTARPATGTRPAGFHNCEEFVLGTGPGRLRKRTSQLCQGVRIAAPQGDFSPARRKRFRLPIAGCQKLAVERLLGRK